MTGERPAKPGSKVASVVKRFAPGFCRAETMTVTGVAGEVPALARTRISENAPEIVWRISSVPSELKSRTGAKVPPAWLAKMVYDPRKRPDKITVLASTNEETLTIGPSPLGGTGNATVAMGTRSPG
jgi:hypothetical protein